MIRFACAGCGRTIKADVEHAGRRGKCPNCGNAFIVPEPSTPVARQAAVQEREEALPGRPQATGAPAWKMPALVAAGLVVLLAGGYAAWRWHGVSSDSGAASPAGPGAAPAGRTQAAGGGESQTADGGVRTGTANGAVTSTAGGGGVTAGGAGQTPTVKSASVAAPDPVHVRTKEEAIAQGRKIVRAGGHVALEQLLAGRLPYVCAWYGDADGAFAAESAASQIHVVDGMLRSSISRMQMSPIARLAPRVSLRMAVVEGQICSGDAEGATRTASQVNDSVAVLIDPRNPITTDLMLAPALAFAVSGRHNELSQLLSGDDALIGPVNDIAAVVRARLLLRRNDLPGAAGVASQIQNVSNRQQVTEAIARAALPGPDRALAVSLCRQAVDALCASRSASNESVETAIGFVAAVGMGGDTQGAGAAADALARRFPAVAERVRGVSSSPAKLFESAPTGGEPGTETRHAAWARICLGDPAGARQYLQSRLDLATAMGNSPDKLAEMLAVAEMLLEAGDAPGAASAARLAILLPDAAPVPSTRGRTPAAEAKKHVNYCLKICRVLVRAGDIDGALQWAASDRPASSRIIGYLLDAWFADFMPEWESNMELRRFSFDFRNLMMMSQRRRPPGSQGFPQRYDPRGMPPGMPPFAPGQMPPRQR